MIRERDIRNSCRELATLQARARKLECEIETGNRDLDETETSFEYAILDAHITGSEKELLALQDRISEKEQEIKIMRGLASPARIKPWTKLKKEVLITAYGAV